jgi:predicted TIM-barrel fold metal-dependent hydrolase
VIVDAHAHAFLPATALARAVDALAPVERAALVEDFLAIMAANGVERAVLVPLGTEDAYVARALREHPGRFAAVAVIHEPPTVAQLEARRAACGFHAVRTQWLGDPGRPLAESPLLEVLGHLAAERLPLWSYLTPDQRPLLEQLPEVVPELTIVLNHLGFFPHDMRVDAHGRPAFDDPLPAAHVETVLALARHPRVHVMLSGQYALSAEAPPHRDLDGMIRRIADAYGAERMLWGSDHPWIRDVPGYAAQLSLAASALAGASPPELAEIHGGTALRLFPHLAR